MQPLFRTKEKDDSGAIGLQLWIRGKPWNLVIDSDLLFNEDASKDPKFSLEFSNHDTTKKVFWGALLEKGWAKAKGNYEAMNGSVYANNSLRALTGFPVFTYLNDDYTDTKNTNIPALFKLIDDGLKANYLAGFETVGFPGQSNKCGLPNFHAYSILGAFTVDTTDLLLVRDPTGTTAYKNTDWDKDSAKWTDEAKKLVPLGVDPTTSAA